MYVYCVVVREKGNVDGCADKLVQESVDRGSTDNITAIVIGLSPVSSWERASSVFSQTLLMEQLNEKRLPNKSCKGRREYNGTKEPKVRKIGKRIVEAIRLNRIEHMNDLVITVDQRLKALVHFFIRKNSLVCCEQWIQMFISVRQQLREQNNTIVPSTVPDNRDCDSAACCRSCSARAAQKGRKPTCSATIGSVVRSSLQKELAFLSEHSG